MANNISLFNLSVAGVSGKFSVLSFSLLEGIYGDDLLTVSFIAPSGASGSMVGKDVSFSFEFEGKKEFFNGVATGYSAEQSRVTLSAKTLRHLLDKGKKQAVYCNSDVGAIVRTVLRKAGVLSFKCNLKRFYITDFKIQYNESDLAFLQRILEEFNIMEFARHSEGRSELVISDGGDFAACGLNFAKSRLETSDSENFFFSCGHSPFRPGMSFEFSGETFIVCSVQHIGSQEAAFGIKGKDDGYKCQVAAFSKRSMNSLPHSMEKPKIPGIIVGKTEGFAGAFASIDHKGRYIVRMPFDGENFPMASSIPVHLAQSFAGVGCGVHFPLRGDVPVLIAFENGDIDKPVALGAIPRGLHTGPVIGVNSFQNILKTASGIKLTFDDSMGSFGMEVPKNVLTKAKKGLLFEGEDKSILKTKRGVSLSMNDKKGDLKMDAKRDILINAGKPVPSKADAPPKGNLKLKAPDSISLKTSKTRLDMDDSKKSINMDAPDIIALKTGKTRLGLGDDGENIDMGAKKNVSISASQNLLLKGKRKTVVQTEKGIRITMNDATKSLIIEAPANITIKAGGRLILKGKVVEIN